MEIGEEADLYLAVEAVDHQHCQTCLYSLVELRRAYVDDERNFCNYSIRKLEMKRKME